MPHPTQYRSFRRQTYICLQLSTYETMSEYIILADANGLWYVFIVKDVFIYTFWLTKTWLSVTFYIWHSVWRLIFHWCSPHDESPCDFLTDAPFSVCNFSHRRKCLCALCRLISLSFDSSDMFPCKFFHSEHVHAQVCALKDVFLLALFDLRSPIYMQHLTDDTVSVT